MSEGKPKLTALREELDSIDDTLHDLLMQRAAIAAGVRAAKGEVPVWRPAREAQILRRLISRHSGPFPKATIIQLWREIISAMVHLQGKFSIAVHSPGGDRLCRDLARDHFGVGTTLSAHSSARSVLTAVQEGIATVGVLPIPEDSEEEAWWPALAGISSRKNMSICARLPFSPSTIGNDEAALCVASIEPAESGDDRTFFFFQTPPEISRARLNDSISAAGIKPIRLIGLDSPIDGMSAFLSEVKGFVCPDDPRIARLVDKEIGLAESAFFLGVYATPLTIDDVADGEEV
ncbi:MAG: hypothetical protein CFH41_00159 [Alphaproteobacteria bacterium MarineAlpha11_Bin1]|nr:MAG: hypothetical protein CFH41_00159 [Alphaproteobacteria bacterium MarineAlpha11_Bin1]|tara:strand:- start:60 stop:932 length:873 start_codon:yes stop_codon:yes gene_type:complete